MGRDIAGTEAVVLRSVPYGEADLILTLYTRACGRLSALGRAARKSKRRFGGGIGLFTLSSVDLRGRPGSELWTLQSAQPIHCFTAIAADMGSFAHASYATELVRELSPVEAADEPVLDLLLALYRRLEAGGPVVQMLRAFELGLLDLVGLAPVLDRCVGCGSAAVDGRGVVFDPGRGGVTCAACAALARAPGVRPLSGPARRLLVAAQEAPSLAAAAAHGDGEDAEVAREARDAMLTLILGHIGKPLRSLEFITKMDGAARARRERPPGSGPSGEQT